MELTDELRRQYRHIWQSMKQRCCNTNSPNYERYGGRDIYVCQRWLNSLDNFIQDMHPRPSQNHWLDRIDNDGPYSPENCRWATPKEQLNNRNNNRRITINGETRNLSQWCEHFDLQYPTVRGRLERGWTVQQAFELDAPPVYDPYSEAPVYSLANGDSGILTKLIAKYCPNTPRNTVYSRLNKQGWTLEQALEIESR